MRAAPRAPRRSAADRSPSAASSGFAFRSACHLAAIRLPSQWMESESQHDGDGKHRLAAATKITIASSCVDLGRIDLLVHDFYSTRSDFFRTVRNRHCTPVTTRAIERHVPGRPAHPGRRGARKHPHPRRNVASARRRARPDPRPTSAPSSPGLPGLCHRARRAAGDPGGQGPWPAGSDSERNERNAVRLHGGDAPRDGRRPRALDVAGAIRIIRLALGGRGPDPAEAAPRRRGPRPGGMPEVEDAEGGGATAPPPPAPAAAQRGRPAAARGPVRSARPWSHRRHARCPAADPRRRIFRSPSPRLRRRQPRASPLRAGGGGAGIEVVVMLHGCTQSPDDFALGTGMNQIAEAHSLLVVYPAQTAIHNPESCWNWFRREDQAPAGRTGDHRRPDHGAAAEFAVNPSGRVFVAGLSAGGAMAAVMGETYPELYIAIGVHSGLPRARRAMWPPPSRRCARSRLPSSAPRLEERPGYADNRLPRRADRTVHPSNAAQVLGRSRSDARTERAQVGERLPGGAPHRRQASRRKDSRRTLAGGRRGPRLVRRGPRGVPHRPPSGPEPRPRWSASFWSPDLSQASGTHLPQRGRHHPPELAVLLSFEMYAVERARTR